MNKELTQSVIRNVVKGPMRFRSIRRFFAQFTLSEVEGLRMTEEGRRAGFTLIELLVVVAVLSVVGSIVIGIITFSLRASNKTNTIENIRQSGNYAISQMVKTIEYAQTFDGLSTDGTTYVKSCPVTQPTPTPTSSSYSHIKVTPFNDDTIVYSCSLVGGFPTLAHQQPPTEAAVSLIDTTSIQVTDCSFTCIVRSFDDVPIINIKFVLQPAISSTLVEKFTPPITFETSVTMRNYQR